MPRIVVLGTGTGVGKTYFTVSLARALAKGRGAAVLALKPVETGVSGGRHRSSNRTDAARLSAASTLRAPEQHPLFAFNDPISPHLAARRARRPLSLTKINAWVRDADANDNPLRDITIRWTLVETAGGAFSPLSPTASNADLATALEPAIWILVASDALGVLHDVRATLLALRHAARAPDFVVLSAAQRRDASTGTNAAELARLGIVHPIATLPRAARPGRALARLVSALRARASKLP